jgi:hypothetical protein
MVTKPRDIHPMPQGSFQHRRTSIDLDLHSIDRQFDHRFTPLKII